MENGPRHVPRGDYVGVSDRGLLERAADNSLYAVEAVGQLTREVSETNRRLARVEEKLEDGEDTAKHDLREALKESRKAQAWWVRFTVVTLVGAGMGALGAVLGHFLLGGH